MAFKKSGQVSLGQKLAMVEFLQDHPKLTGVQSGEDLTVKETLDLWEELADKLNTIPGVQRDGKMWRRTWQDFKGTIKGKIVKAQATDNELILAPVDEEIFDIMTKSLAAKREISEIAPKAWHSFRNTGEIKTSPLHTIESHVRQIPNSDVEFICVAQNRTARNENRIEFTKKRSRRVSERFSEPASPSSPTHEPSQGGKRQCTAGNNRFYHNVSTAEKLIEIKKQRLDQEKLYQTRKIEAMDKANAINLRKVKALERLSDQISRCFSND